MALVYTLGINAGTGIRHDLGTADSLYVGRGATVLSSDNAAVTGGGSSQQVTVAGEIHAWGSGLSWGAGSNLRVEILAGGSVSSSVGSGIYVTSVTSTRIVNQGSVTGLTNGINLGSDTAVLINTGLISSRDYGLQIYSVSDAAGTAVTTYNHGTITGGTAAYYGDASFDDRLFNYGTITGKIFQLDGNDYLLNRGLITGDVELGSGNDVLDNRSGTIDGIVFGGDGNDTFILNPLVAEIVNGGNGADVLDFRQGGSVIVALDYTRNNAGQSLGDQYYNMENVFGSQGNDIITGNNSNNVLTGEDGNDWLHGRDGNDILRGGAGADTLAGGQGNDIFQYMTPTDGGDRIMDFGATATNNDAFQFSAAGFGGGLVAGALPGAAFQSGATNVAASAGIRFMYRTTDSTVWFDADGNGGGAAVLIATLQAGAVVTAVDFLIF